MSNRREYWELPWEEFLKLPLGTYNEYELEIEAVARGNKSLHFGFYPVDEFCQFKLLQKAATQYKLHVLRGAGKNDFTISQDTNFGCCAASKIKYLIMKSNIDEDLLVDSSWHREFCEVLGYDKELAEKVKGLRGPEILEKKRHYKHFIQNAMFDLSRIPDDVLTQAEKMFPDLYEYGKYLEME